MSKLTFHNHRLIKAFEVCKLPQKTTRENFKRDTISNKKPTGDKL